MKKYLQYIKEKIEFEKPFFMYDRNELIMKNLEEKGITGDKIFLKNISLDGFFKSVSENIDKLYLGYTNKNGPTGTKSILFIYDILNRNLDDKTIESLWESDDDVWGELKKLNCITVLIYMNKKAKVVFHMWDECDNKLHYYEVLKYVDAPLILNDLFPIIADKIAKNPFLIANSYIKNMLNDFPEIWNQIKIKDQKLGSSYNWGLI